MKMNHTFTVQFRKIEIKIQEMKLELSKSVVWNETVQRTQAYSA